MVAPSTLLLSRVEESPNLDVEFRALSERPRRRGEAGRVAQVEAVDAPDILRADGLAALVVLVATTRDDDTLLASQDASV